MKLFILLIIVGVVVFLIVKAQSTSRDSGGPVSQQRGEPRDYLEECKGFLGFQKHPTEMLKEDRLAVINTLKKGLRNGGTIVRKSAAYGLGQVGDSSIIGELESAISRESVQGVKEALEASFVAIQMAPAEKGFSELDRRRIIEDVYHKRSPRIPRAPSQ